MISSTFLFGYSFFQPSTPHIVIFIALLSGGFFRSLQMTSLNTLAYADVPPGMLSRATSTSYEIERATQGPAHDKALREAVEEARPNFRQCPKCGAAALIRRENCDICTSCEYEKCRCRISSCVHDREMPVT